MLIDVSDITRVLVLASSRLLEAMRDTTCVLRFRGACASLGSDLQVRDRFTVGWVLMRAEFEWRH